MTSRDFCYWLQGFLELHQPKTLTAKQVREVKKHLALVFIHDIDPSAGGPEEQKKLNEIHQGLEKVKKELKNHSHQYVPPPVYRC